MWSCVKCEEKSQDGVLTCWNCGTTRDGTEDPSFRTVAERDVAPAEEPRYSDPIDAQLAHRFICDRCGDTRARVRRFAATGTGITRLIDLQTEEFIAVGCMRCGFTEIFDPEPLQGSSNLGALLDLIF